jgi:hypothetical protein
MTETIAHSIPILIVASLMRSEAQARSIDEILLSQGPRVHPHPYSLSLSIGNLLKSSGIDDTPFIQMDWSDVEVTASKSLELSEKVDLSPSEHVYAPIIDANEDVSFDNTSYNTSFSDCMTLDPYIAISPPNDSSWAMDDLFFPENEHFSTSNVDWKENIMPEQEIQRIREKQAILEIPHRVAFFKRHGKLRQHALLNYFHTSHAQIEDVSS